MALTILVDGLVDVPADIEIPGADITRPSRRRPCHVTVSAMRAHYIGDDIGSRWQIEIAADGIIWRSGTINFPFSTTWPIGALLEDNRREGACGSLVEIAISIKGREISSLFPNLGEAVRVVPAPCSDKEYETYVLVPLVVRRRWGLNCFSFSARAILVFLLRITTRCESS